VTAVVIEALAHADAVDARVAANVRTWFEGEMLMSDGFFRYTAGSDVRVHNANALAARAFHRVGGSPDLVATAVRLTLAKQRRDGSWPYGEHPGLDWVDNFHTVYVLDALVDLFDLVPEAEAHLMRGVDYWLNAFFSADGRTLYYPARQRPVDLHNLATALYGLVRFAPIDGHAAERVPAALAALLEHQRVDGGFRRRPRPVFMRWNQAHALHALGHVLLQGEQA
jgi:hypothetical protein